MARSDEQSTANAHGRRSRLIKARENHDLSREEAETLVKRRAPRLAINGLQRAIEERRARRGLSQPDLAILVGCSQNEISKIETGERKRIAPQYIEAIARVLRMSRDEVAFGGSQPEAWGVSGEVLGDEAIRVYSKCEAIKLKGFRPAGETEGYRVAVHDLEPWYGLGDILLVGRESVPIDECVGRYCIAEIDGTKYVGLVEAGASPRLITLRRSRRQNATLIDRTPSWIGPIIAIYLSGPIAP